MSEPLSSNPKNMEVAGIISAINSVLGKQSPYYCNEVRLPAEKAKALLAYIAALERQADETTAGPLKGVFEGLCNRTACGRRPATWYSEVEKAHYCETCAIEINKWVPANVSRLVKVIPDREALRDALRVYGGHVPPCPGRPCACGFQQAWDAAGLTVKTRAEPT